jgi:dihydrofolate reductase
MRNENMSQPNIRLSLLVAADEANVIGKDNRLPWHLPSDLKYFKNLTWGMPVAMGRKTFESIGKPLPGRINIVITRNRAWAFEKVSVAHSLEVAAAHAADTGAQALFVIGGAEIFEMALPQASRIYLTRIHHRFEGDVFFPKLSPAEWHLAKSHRHEPDAKNIYAHTFEEWERRAAVQE